MEGFFKEEKYSFVGRYSVFVDDKYRLAVPSPFRKIIAQESSPTLFLASGLPGVLFVFTQSIWDKFCRLHNPKDSLFNPKTWELTHDTWPVNMDNLGRILITERMRERFKITVGSEVVVVGNGLIFSFWTREIYDKTLGKRDPTDFWKELLGEGWAEKGWFVEEG